VLIALVPVILRQTAPSADSFASVRGAERWLQPVGGTLKNYFRHLARLAASTIPLMILAAILGAVVAELVPAQDVPAKVSVVGIILVALVGAFLPVPMAFDVAAAFILMARGVPMPYVVTLLCTRVLSASTRCSFWAAPSPGTTVTVFGAVMLVGICAGVETGLLQHSL
jgi:hypothetical protein